MRNPHNLIAAAVALAVSASFPMTTMAQDDEVIEEVVTVGTRSATPRTAADSTVPIDVVNNDDLNAMGNTADLTDNLKALIPSYTATPATGDGSAFVRPTSLRGTAPDQSLVLVNGKRRHRSALVQFFAPAAGNGAHGVDIGMIPAIAVKRVEVLRDGAAAQYGSDAIAGVINFVMKDAAEGGEVQAQYGEFFDGEQSLKVAANAGFGIGDAGFINLSLEVTDNDALSRGIQRPDAQGLIDGGNTAVGQDAVFGDAPFTQTWGRPQTEGVRFFANSAFDIGSSSQLYARLGVADTDGRYRFFYRNPDTNSAMVSLRDQGFTGLPGGFTPYLDGNQKDTSLVVGFDGEFGGGMMYDFSVGYGQAKLDYFLNNTVNQDLGIIDATTLPQMDFDVGGYEQEETNLNADFSKRLGDRMNLGFGAEWREESYTVVSGEESASVGVGSSGFKGITAEDGGTFKRDNFAVYGDLEFDVSDALLLQGALRYEDFSDFGDTINGKVAARWRLGEAFALRGAVSTGFHAPTPGQANVQTTITTFDGATGLQVEEGLVPPTSEGALEVGGAPLTEEKSVNLSAGFTADFFSNTTVTLDVYNIEVSDRIYRTSDITVPSSGATISFYTNALDVEHRGLDLVVTSGFEYGSASGTDLTLAYGYNQIEVTGQTQVDGTDPVSASLIEDIENNYPEHRWVLTANNYFGERWNLMARINYYGEHYDERGIIGGSAEIDDVTGEPTGRTVDSSHLMSSAIFLDLELGYQITENFRLALGGTNVTDEFIDTIDDQFRNDVQEANRISVGLQYPRRTVANYEGGSWYLKGIFNW